MNNTQTDRPDVMDRLDAMDLDNFDPVEYQEEGQGKPHQGLKKELKKQAHRK